MVTLNWCKFFFLSLPVFLILLKQIDNRCFYHKRDIIERKNKRACKSAASSSTSDILSKNKLSHQLYWTGMKDLLWLWLNKGWAEWVDWYNHALSEKNIWKQGSSNDIHCGKSQLKFHSHVQYHLLKKKKKGVKGKLKHLGWDWSWLKSSKNQNLKPSCTRHPSTSSVSLPVPQFIYYMDYTTHEYE